MENVKWKCNKCGFITLEKPNNRNSTCKSCNKGRYRIIKTCVCGNEFMPETYSQKYCSNKCRYENQSYGGKKGKHYPHTQRAKVVICLKCGNEFRATSDYKNRHAKYCSKECWNKRSQIINYCKYCGKSIITTKSINKQYCDINCRNLHYRTTHQGEKSYFWKGGKTKESKLRRTTKEYKEWREKVFKRDNYTCQQCGSKKELEAHHIKEQSLYPELIYEVENGLTLCHECHKKTENYGRKVTSNKERSLNA